MLPHPVKKVLKMLKQYQFEGYLVGGAVRDLLLLKTPKDWDITTNAPIEKLKEIFCDEKIVETGIQHGTICVYIDHFPVEITTYRGKENQFMEDLLLRDFTINAICMNEQEEIIDPLHGREDLNRKTIQCCGPESLCNDPLRILRAIRFAAQYAFQIEDETNKQLTIHKEKLLQVAYERISNEFCKMMIYPQVATYLIKYQEIFFVFLPELKPMVHFEQHNPYHIYDIFTHTMKVVENTSSGLIVRLAALFHDIGKVKTFTMDENRIGHFYGHPDVSAQMTEIILNRLKLDKHTIKRVCHLIQYHDYRCNETKKSLRKFLALFGAEDLSLLFELKKADAKAQNPVFLQERLQHLDRSYEILQNMIAKKECFSRRQLAIKGNDLLQLGFSGIQIGKVLDELLEKVISEQLPNERNSLIDYAKSLKETSN